MISKRELEQAIRECENGRVSYQNCEKLATFYTLYDHLYAEYPQEEVVYQPRIESKVLEIAGNKDAIEVWALVDELVDAVQVLNPKLYQNFIAKLAE